MSICLCSCEQETVYSCNASVDEWVHENLSDIQVMTRSEWNNLEEELKIPAYRAFTFQQRIDFWNERCTEMLSLEWSDEEKEHITLLLNFINEHTNFLNGYSSMSDEEKNVFDLFFYQWRDKARTDFNWSDNLLRAVLASGNKLLDTKGTLLINQGNNRTSLLSDSESDCNCSQSSDWCTPPGWDCEDVSWCEEDTWGCGTILAYDCDGRCGGI